MRNNNSGEIWTWGVCWTIETLIIHFSFGVGWLFSILLAVTIGSLGVWVLKHLPDLID